MKWHLRHSSAERSFAAWGISGLTRRRTSQAADQVGFMLDGAAFDGLAPFAAGDEITILRDGTPWFVGRITALSRGATGRTESIAYQVAGPWWYLENLVYQQVWNVYGGGEIRKSHALLNTYADGLLMGVREQLHDALTWASARAVERYGSAPFQWDPSTFPTASIPADEVRDVTVAEVVRKQLRWIPDAVTWWDYTTTPPTFRVSRRSALEAADLTGPTAAITSVILNPRHDLVVPAVVLKYEQTSTVDGVSFSGLTVDAAPSGADGTEFGALVATVDLRGTSVSYARATITTAALPATNAELWEWLKSKQPHLASPQVTLDTILGVDRHPSADPDSDDVLPRELVDGQIADWLDARAQQETVTIRARLRVDNPEGMRVDLVDKEFSVNFIATDAASGDYSQVESLEVGEAAPVGLAQVLYDALSVLEHEGTLTIVRQEVGDAPQMGQCLNLSGWRPEWATMRAVIQEVAEDVDLGTTTIRVGPPQHLGPRDLVELLRVNRFRLIMTPRSERAGGASSGRGIGLGRSMRLENGTSGSTTRRQLVIRYEAGSINLDAQLTNGKEMLPREVEVCVDGEAKRMLLLCSEPYDP